MGGALKKKGGGDLCLLPDPSYQANHVKMDLKVVFQTNKKKKKTHTHTHTHARACAP